MCVSTNISIHKYLLTNRGFIEGEFEAKMLWSSFGATAFGDVGPHVQILGESRGGYFRHVAVQHINQ